MDYVVIVAGGKGLRMGGEVPKQFLPVGGIPILMRTIIRFHEYSSDLKVILVLPSSQQDYWWSLCEKYNFHIPYILADGGETRFASVKSGLSFIPDDIDGVVGVHDGVRPFVSADVITDCYRSANVHGAVIPVVRVVETLRHISGNTVPRDEYRLVQTPQTFDIQLLKKAYSQPYRDSFTDDASVVESIGRDVVLIEGNSENIKITTPFDLIVAEALSRNNA
jgi:2-C-methyl-D-erythritol 4-phosphate cytidylyltransferase